MRSIILSILIVLGAAAGCATTTDLSTSQRRAVVAIQAAQQTATRNLVTGVYTLKQDQDRQALLAKARADVLKATTVAEVDAAIKAAGVTP